MAVTTQEISSRQRILDVGARLFLERGYADTTLRMIGAEVGMQAASIYYHFPSKDDLLTEILEHGITAISNAFDDGVEGLEGEAAFAAAIDAHLTALFAEGPFTAAHVTVFRRAPLGVRTTIVPWRDAYEARWDRLLRDIQAHGALASDLDLRLVRLTLLGAMNNSLEWFKPSGSQTVPGLAAVITRQFWSGLAAETKARI